MIVTTCSGDEWRLNAALSDAREQLRYEQHTDCGAMARLILQRQGVPPDDVLSFMAPTLKDLCPDPSTLKDMKKATARLAHALETKERIAILGDYDVDGAASTALMVSSLEAMTTGMNAPGIQFTIPDRLKDGYGPNIQLIDDIKTGGAELLILVDCGTTSFEALAHAKVQGLDVIVIDHHQSQESLPSAHAIINPNRQDDLSGCGHLCAAGVCFLTLIALRTHILETTQNEILKTNVKALNLINKLDVVALATVADIVPLSGVNRAFVTQGLKVMHNRINLGLAALADIANVMSAPEPYHLGFVFGPRINAGGRIGKAARGAELLLSKDPNTAFAIAKELDTLNKERRTLQDKAVKDAIDEIERTEGDLLKSQDEPIILANKNWHIGIVGLIAARLKEKYQRPSIAFGLNDDKWSGSARSVAGIDVGRVIMACVEQGALDKGGGHAMAAGMSVAKDNIEGAITALSAALSAASNTAGDAVVRHQSFDGHVHADQITLPALKELELLGPFGAANPTPVFLCEGLTLTACIPIKETHLKLQLKTQSGARLEAMAFYALEGEMGKVLKDRVNQPVSLLATPQINRWGGREAPQLLVKDVVTQAI